MIFNEVIRGQVNKFLENLSEDTRSVMSHYFLTSIISQLITVKFWAEFIAWFHFCRRLKRKIFVFFAKWKKTSFVQFKHLHMKGLTPKKIKTELNNVHSTSAPAFATVYNWMNKFKRGRTSMMHLVRDIQLRLPRQKSSIKFMILFWLIDEWKCASLLRHITWYMVISILYE